MIFNQVNFSEDIREIFCNAIIKIFGDTSKFLDFIEGDCFSIIKYDCFLNCDGENYIINRETGEYINWYKLNHIGRCINVSILSTYESMSKWFEKFLSEFKGNEVKDNAR